MDFGLECVLGSGPFSDFFFVGNFYVTNGWKSVLWRLNGLIRLKLKLSERVKVISDSKNSFLEFSSSVLTNCSIALGPLFFLPFFCPSCFLSFFKMVCVTSSILSIYYLPTFLIIYVLNM